MSEAISYTSGGAELLLHCGPLWEKLRVHQTERAAVFAAPLRRAQWDERRANFESKVDGGGALSTYLAWCGESAIGYCIATIDAARVGEIESVFVESNYRRMGVGRALLEAAFAWFDGEGIRHRKIGVVAGNEEAISFYRRFGYEPSATVLRHRDSFD